MSEIDTPIDGNPTEKMTLLSFSMGATVNTFYSKIILPDIRRGSKMSGIKAHITSSLFEVVLSSIVVMTSTFVYDSQANSHRGGYQS